MRVSVDLTRSGAVSAQDSAWFFRSVYSFRELIIPAVPYVMADKVVGRPWTAEEDNLLIQAVAIHGQNDNWKQVALAVPGRTNKACRKVRDQ